MFDDMSDKSLAIQQDDMGIFDEVDEVIGKSMVIGDPKLAFDYGRNNLIRVGLLRGLALAKLLYRLQEHWDLYVTAGTADDLMTMAYTEMGVKAGTSSKYIRMWESIFENPDIEEGTKNMLRGKPIGELLLITAAAREGSLDNDDLQTLATFDRNQIREMVKEKRGHATSSKTAITICLQMKDGKYPAGTIYAKQDDKYEIIAYKVPELSELGEKAFARLMNSCGAVEIYNAG
jgi:hypothetical protein